MKIRLAGLAATALLCSTTPSWAADVVRTIDGKSGVASVVSVGSLVYPSATGGSDANGVKQVEEAVTRMHEALGKRGLGIGNMLQHTVFVKDGAVNPMDVLKTMHGTATRLAPSLKFDRSVGTIIRVPGFADPKTVVMLDVVAGTPPMAGERDGFKRIGFKFGPQEIAETVGLGPLVYTSGLEAMDFEHGTLVPDIDSQIEVIVGKLNAALTNQGLSMGNMISHNLYVQTGTDPIRVITKFHEATQKLAPSLKAQPSVGTLVVVDGMAGPGFKLEMDAVAALPKQPGATDGYSRVLFAKETQMTDIAQSVQVGDLVHLSGMEGVDFANGGAIAPDVYAQVDVAVNKINNTLRQSGMSIGDMVKYHLYIKKGNDVAKVREHFLKAATKLAPSLKKKPAAELVLVVEGLAVEPLQFEARVIAAKSK